MVWRIIINLAVVFLAFSAPLLSAEIYHKPMPASVSLDPQTSKYSYSLAITNQIFDRLFDIDEFGKVKSKLVSKWETTSDSSYRICLRDDVSFHNNKPLNSDDVSFTLYRLLSKKSIVHNEFSIIKGAREFQKGKQNSVSGIKIESPLCFSVELEKPYPLFISMLAAPSAQIFPLNFGGKSEEAFFSSPIGTGPFKLTKYGPNEIELSANEKYFLGSPQLKTIIYERVNRFDAINKFNKGYYQDLEWFFPQVTELDSNYAVVKTPISMTNVLAFNFTREPFKNIHFRRALQYAINKKELVDSCFPGNIVAKGYIPPGMAGYNKETLDYEYNVQQAKGELKLAKLSEEVSTKEIIILRPDNHPCKELFKKLVETDFNAIGINAKVVHIPFDEIMRKYYEPRNFDMLSLSFSSDFPEALFMLNYFKSDSPMNFSGFLSKEIDNYLEIAISASDRFERYQAYEKIQEILQDYAATVNLYYYVASIVMQNNVKGYIPSHFGVYYSSMQPVYLEENGE